MHYNEDKLYFYFKDDIDKYQKKAIKEHLKTCAVCRHKLKKVSKISGLFKLTMEKFPGLEARKWPRKSVTNIWRLFLKPATVVLCSIFILFSALFIVHYKFKKESKNKDVYEFVYTTYKTMYDFDYYQEKYLDKSY